MVQHSEHDTLGWSVTACACRLSASPNTSHGACVQLRYLQPEPGRAGLGFRQPSSGRGSPHPCSSWGGASVGMGPALWVLGWLSTSGWGGLGTSPGEEGSRSPSRAAGV